MSEPPAPRLRDRDWRTKYDSDTRSLLTDFYVPALACALRYDRSTGYFSSRALTLAARGIEGLVRSGGHMRLVVGCTLAPAEIEAIERGTALREVVGTLLGAMPLVTATAEEAEALELVAWMIAKGVLDVKVAVPCDASRKPCTADGIFHEKAGIIEDAATDRVAFNGSVNETAMGWGFGTAGNWESFHTFTSFGPGAAHVDAEEESFARLWSDKARHARVVDVPTAVREDLLRFLPESDARPRRLFVDDSKEVIAAPVEVPPVEPQAPVEPPPSIDVGELRRRVWAIIRTAPSVAGGGESIGEATSAVLPWPHQVRAFQRMYEQWPPKLLIADEVGLGKTIEAGLLLRQAWLSGRARRILILAPRAVVAQWQVELREKFNLNWPIYDGGTLRWYQCNALGERAEREVPRDQWHKESCIITSSHLMRRSDRALELLNAEPWDLVVLDEAHHARRRGAGSVKDKGPNHLLLLMQQLRQKTQGLILLTATPMQVAPIEVWDLLNLLDMPPAWTGPAFLRFFEAASAPSPSHADFAFLAQMFRAIEAHFGETPVESVLRWVDGSTLAAKKILQALRDPAENPRRQLSAERRRAAVQVMRANTVVRRLVSRHTRELLRRAHAAGKLETRIATRQVKDIFVKLTPDERSVYEEVERYIADTYNKAEAKERSAVGFVMTSYRRRLSSSFAALRATLSNRLADVKGGPAKETSSSRATSREDDLSDDETRDETMDTDEADELERRSLAAEEVHGIEDLLRDVRRLPTDTKARKLISVLDELRKDGYEQSIIFTQFTDTMDFLRGHLRKEGRNVMCFSGRGGEVVNPSGNWDVVERREVIRRFRAKHADVLVATDAASEGLNFQFCGAVVNYDMPWNPMRVEQRIGRIDRVGQAFEFIRIVNLHYEDTVETDVYMALRERIGLFSQIVGKLQPILAALPRRLAQVSLVPSGTQEQERASLVSHLQDDITQQQADAFDLDEATPDDFEEPTQPKPFYDLDDLDALIRRPELLPAGQEITSLSPREYGLLVPGMRAPLRVTTSRDLFVDQPGSCELWSPGSPLFPMSDDGVAVADVNVEALANLLRAEK